MTISVTGMGLLAPGVRGPGDLTGSGAPHPAEADQDWFDPVPYLGRRGWKYLTPATRYLLAAANEATGRRQGDGPPPGHDADRFGVCAGTHHSITALHARLDRSVREEGTAGLSPAELPGFSVNMPASQLAISLACRAFSVTLTNPVVGGLDAVLFAMSALRRGRADRVLATATEDADASAGTLGGAAALLLDRGADPAAAELTGGTSRFVPRSAGGGWEHGALTAAVGRVAAPHTTDQVVRYAFCGSAETAPVDEAVQEAFAACGVPVKPTAYTGSDARFGTVSALFQLIGLLHEPGPGLVVAVADDGHLAAVTVRGAAEGGPARI
ncbi:beta-ketoacyl synthase N-terminal-like domain-containing protein [Streptomyces sp. NPDC006733]|uniref:beta-ketoacyl synthase N-terminal-like domain-containing protein n=1 Tax=Streptomyces sp. NPDC006733 TaxID=3155460 RepID=UPI0033EC60D8